MKQRFSITLTLLFSILLFTQCASVKSSALVKQNKETVRLWFEEGWNNNRNEELIEQCFHPNWHDGNPLLADQVEGYEGMIQLVRNYKNGTTGAYFTITHLFADETHVTIRFEVVATHTGMLFGIPATGRKFTSTGLVLYEMKDGRIAVSWQELDVTGIRNQLTN